MFFSYQGCTERPSGESALFDTLEVVRVINQQAHELSQIMGDIDLPVLANICGIETSEAGALQQFANFLHDISHLLNRSFIGVMDLLSCKSFNPIYTTFVYDGEFTCYHNVLLGGLAVPVLLVSSSKCLIRHLFYLVN